MGILASLFVEIGADWTKFDKSIKDKLRSTSTVSGKAGSTGGGSALGTGAMAGATAGAVMKFFDMGIKFFKKNLEQSKMLSLISDVLSGTIGTATDIIMFAALSSMAIGKEMLGGIITLTQSFIGDMIPRLTALYDQIKDNLAPIMSGMSSLIYTTLDHGFQNILNVFDNVIAPLTAQVFEVLDRNMPLLNNIWSGIQDLNSGILNLSTSVMGHLTVSVVGAIDSMLTIFSPFFSYMSWWMEAIAGPALNYIADGIQIYTGVTQKMSAGLTGGISSVYDKVGELFGVSGKNESNTEKIERNTKIAGRHDELGAWLMKFMVDNPQMQGKVADLRSLGFSFAEIALMIQEGIQKAQMGKELEKGYPGVSSNGRGG